MLSRVADSLYWMSRYIERAENIARIIDVNLQLLLDYEKIDSERLREHWEPIVRTTGNDATFYKLYKEARSDTVTEFLTFNEENPSSIICCIRGARENARMVRDQVSTDMWEEINRFHLYLRSPESRKDWKKNPFDFYKRVRDYSYTFQGLTNATISHTEGWEFMQVAKYLERADMTTRLLDVKYLMTRRSEDPTAQNPDNLQWMAVLRSCSAYDNYHQIYVSHVEPQKVIEFLVFSNEFPRAIKFCIRGVDSAFRRISGVTDGYFSNHAERVSGRLLADLNFHTLDEILQGDLHNYLDNLQTRFNQVGDAIYSTYINHPDAVEK